MTSTAGDGFIYGFAGFVVGSITTFALRRRFERLFTIVRHVKQGPTKMVLVVRTDLPMSTGKVASQCCHAAVTCYHQALRSQPDMAKFWGASGQAKVVLKCQSERFLNQLQTEAARNKIISYIVTDAGRTQVAPGTKTVIGIGPGLVSDIDNITGSLKVF